ncbi:MAG: hypothetical protein INH41_21010 [Myxococcaceae bacterium]|nr:hypothetical protein [Myxococcaceae bacterium]
MTEGGARAVVATLSLLLSLFAGCRRSFTGADQAFFANVDAARTTSDGGRDGELALAICSDARRAAHRRAPLVRVAPARFRDCGGTQAPAALGESLEAARVVLATCSPGGEELLLRGDRAVFARWPDERLDALACVGKCRGGVCAPPCSESALPLAASLCPPGPFAFGPIVRVALEEPWPEP